MSLEALRQNLIDEAKGGEIAINAQTFADAPLQPPADLDALLKKAFLEFDPKVGLVIKTNEGNIGPIQNEGDESYFRVTGLINQQIARDKNVQIKFAATGTQGALVIGIELTNDWRFGQSFTPLMGKMFAELKATDPYFFFAGQQENDYPWSNTTVSLTPGLNFAGSVALNSYLAAVLELLPGFTPAPSYVLSGIVDPSEQAKYGYPGLVLTSTRLADGAFKIGYLEIDAPFLSVTLVDYGEEMGFAPAVMLAAALLIPGGTTPEFRAQLPVLGNVKLTAFTIRDPKGGLALTADQLFALMAGQTWFGLVPPALSSFLQQFGFRSFGMVVSYGNGLRINNVEVVIASGSPWVVWTDPLLEFTFELGWTIQSPFQQGQSHYAVLKAATRFMPELFPREFVFSIDTDMVVSGGYTAADPSEYVSFNKLVEAITFGVIKVPEQFITVLLQEFFLTVDQPARSFSMGATTSIKLPIVGEGKFELNDVALRLGVQRPQAAGQPGNDGTIYTGSINGSLVIGPLFLVAGGSYEAGVWNFSIAMQPGTKLGLQDLINSIFEDVKLPTDIFDFDVQISDVALRAVVPAEKNLATTYSGGGSIRWRFSILSQTIDTLARVSLTYNSKTLPSPYTGSVTATTTFDIFGIGATFTVGYEIKNEPGKPQATEVIFLSWEGLTARYIQGGGQKVLEFTADNSWNLGRLINAFVQIVAPTANRELPSPWNLLNNVSLAGLKVVFNLETKEVTAAWPLKVNLFFAEITSLNITKKQNQPIEVTLAGKFLFNNTNETKWDPVTQNPPQVPGGGDSAFDLRLLALGQHVTVPNLAEIKTVNDAVDQLKGFKQPLPATRIVPVGPGIPKSPATPPNTALMAVEADPPLFSRDSNWLIGTHFFAVSNTLDLKIIFNDPVLYGLRIALAGPKAKIFAGLEFEIMYKRITESIGMYKLMLKLPDAMRYLQFGSVTVILPIVSIEIYTNGNFKIDFGFPYNMDFSVSFTVQVFPFTGSGGFYFGLLNGATSSQVPKDTPCGNFTPVIEFGLGLQVGLGKSVSIAILKAEIAVTVFGIVEGVVATWRAYDDSDLLMEGRDGSRFLFGPDTRALAAATSGNANVETAYYYKLSGTLGIIGKIVGVVDFGIIKAEVELTVYAYIKGTFEAYRKSIVTMEAGVRVSLKFTINCGFFKITISLSFSARIKETFVIGSDHLQDAPWYCGGASGSRLLAAAPRMSLMAAVQLYAIQPNFGPLKTPATGTLPLDIFFMPQLSISGERPADKPDQAAVYSINLFISNELRTQDDEAYRSFERLVRDTYLWIASSFSGRAEKGTPAEELQQTTLLSQMDAAFAYLTTNSDGRSLTYEEAAANLAALFKLDIQLPPQAASLDDPSDGVDTTAFPMPAELTLKATYKSETIADVDFNDWAVATDAYLEDLQKRINRLIAQMLDELERGNDQQAATRALLRQEEADENSLAAFVFVDYFAMAAQYLVQGAIDAFENYVYALEDNDSISAIRKKFNAIGDGQNALTDEQIAWANREHSITPDLPLTINGVPYRIQSGDTWGAIAASNGLQPGPMATDNAAVEQVLIPGRPITINETIKTVPNNGSIAATALEFDLTPAEFSVAIKDMADLLKPLTVITLNGLQHTTAADGADTIAGLMQDYGIDIQTLTPSISEVNNLLDRAALATVILPDLRALANTELWNDITNRHGVAHLSGMAARYLLSGLRLPVEGITFKYPNHPCTEEETCGLQSLTGQQFTLPSLDGYDVNDPLLITLANGADVPWITFTNPVNPDDPSQLPFTLPEAAATQVDDLVKVARDKGLQAPIEPPAPLNLVEDRPRQYTFSNDMILQTATTLPLPNNDLPEGTTPRPRIWNFPVALVSELGRPVALDPRFIIEIGSSNREGSQVIPRPALAYGFSTLINVAVKRVVLNEAGAPVLPSTYELVGADQVGINQLEQLLGIIKPGDVSIINQIYIVYQPNQTSDRAEGLQYDGDQKYATFLVQANLSSETNPPAGTTRTQLLAEDEPPRGLLNNPYQFLSELWSGSIVRSGGYYFFYELADGNALPDTLFNEDNIANISVLIVYNPLEGIAGGNGGLLKNFMNAAVVNDPIDNESDVVYLKSLSRPASVKMESTMSLADIAAAYHLGVIDIAEANAPHLLSTDAAIDVTDIVHQVKRGETLTQIAAYFNTSEQKIKDDNPNVDFNNLTPGTGLHIPDLTTKPGSPKPGQTLPAIAHYYDSSLAALAWANRYVKGLYTSDSPLTFDDLLLDKQSMLPPGNVGIVVTRKNPGSDQTQPAVYLEQQYNMLGYDVVTNTDCIAIADALPLPSTPAEDESEQEVTEIRRAAPAAASAESPWLYTFTVPATRAARNNPAPQSTTESPYPDHTMNPYAGVGGFVQLSLDWRDMMGNRMWSPFDDNSPGNNYPLNDPPSRMGFTDDVIGLGQWPSTHFDHFFDKGNSSPQLNIDWSFDPSRYAKDQPPAASDEMPAWERNAKADRQVFANIYYQLVQTDRDGNPATEMGTLTTLADDKPQPLTSAEASAVRDYVLAAWRYVEKVLANDGNPPPISDLPLPVHLVRAIDAAGVGIITEIKASFQLRRVTTTILSGFLDEDASRVSTTAIGPRLVKVEQEGQTPGYTLDWYTRQFQEAFNQTSFELRLATGVSRHDLGSGQRRDTLWSVRFGKSSDQPYYYTIDNPAMFFAPAPLSTSLISRPNVSLYSFTPEGGLSPTPDVSQSFTGIDLDVWARTTLAAIDQLLTPQYAVPAFLVDDKGDTDDLQELLDTKFKLARSIVEGVTNILCKPKLDPKTNEANFTAAREKLRQQLLILLENTYSIDAIVQYEMAVTAPKPTVEDEIAPRLYGNPVDPNQSTKAKDYTASSFKVPLANGSSLLTYTFRARDTRRQASFPLTLEYRPTHIEHQITEVPGIEAYKASSWLNFIDSLPSIALAGEVPPVTSIDIDIPIPLRAYPTPPALQNQGFLQDDSGDSPETTLEKAKEWTFRFIYSQVHASQDRIDSVVRLNVPVEGNAKSLAAEPVDLVVMLARIIHVLGQLQAVFEQDLLNVKLNTPISSTTFKQAQNAMNAFATLTDGLDEAWSRWVAPVNTAAKTAASELNQELPFSILEDFIDKGEPPEVGRVLRITVGYPTVLLPGITNPPIVVFEGYIPEEVDPEDGSLLTATGKQRREESHIALARLMAQDGCDTPPDDLTSRKAWIYRKIDPAIAEAVYLTWDEALEMPNRVVDIPELDAIQYQNAWANVRIIRNLNLVGADNPTREPFVYRTPVVQFRNPLRPLLDTSKTINVAKVPTGTIEKRTLVEHLTALFKALFKGSPSQAQLVKLETRYAYALSDAAGAPTIELPVLMVPPTEFQIPADWQSLAETTVGGVDTEAFIVTLAQRITEWFDRYRPSPQSASFLFDLSAFSSLSNNSQPLVRVRNLVLCVEDIKH